MSTPCRLYLVSPPTLLPGFAVALEAALAAGDVGCVQLRLKGVEDGAVVAAARELSEICRAAGVVLLVNDRPDLAARAGADGVHIGQEDATMAEAREVLGPDAIVGVTCRDSRHLAIEAAAAGADYVAFGAFFPTATKASKANAGPDLVEWWADIAVVPQVAIGGIAAANCAPIVRAGADFLAISSAVWEHPGGPASAVAELNAVIAAAAPIERAGAS
jgi:thiamine-phosphate pyrophosphorylase